MVEIEKKRVFCGVLDTLQVMVWANHFASGVHFLLHLAIAHIRFEVVKGKIQGEEQDFMPFLFGRVEQAIC
jgi:hypothetical protein